MSSEIEEHFEDIDKTLEKLRMQLRETIDTLLASIRDLHVGEGNHPGYEASIAHLIGELVLLEDKIRRML